MIWLDKRRPDEIEIGWQARVLKIDTAIPFSNQFSKQPLLNKF